jgi:hypothetical protein
MPERFSGCMARQGRKMLFALAIWQNSGLESNFYAGETSDGVLAGLCA